MLMTVMAWWGTQRTGSSFNSRGAPGVLLEVRVKLPADLHLPRYTKYFSLSGLPTFCSYSD